MEVTSFGELTVDVVDDGLGIEERPVDFEIDGDVEGVSESNEISELIECSEIDVDNAWILDTDVFYM